MLPAFQCAHGKWVFIINLDDQYSKPIIIMKPIKSKALRRSMPKTHNYYGF